LFFIGGLSTAKRAASSVIMQQSCRPLSSKVSRDKKILCTNKKTSQCVICGGIIASERMKHSEFKTNLEM
jgi:hypothetical protein